MLVNCIACKIKCVLLHAVLVDEASMLDMEITAELLRVLPNGCKLVLVGDPNQLPPVGPGNVLHAAMAVGAMPMPTNNGENLVR